MIDSHVPYLRVFTFLTIHVVQDVVVLLYFEIELFQNGNFFSLPIG
ncbi:hypothetical protein BLGI_1379 [Brevibacillus laterosporus GI-9]|nr:hypothetical protein BLGI_1379 [Brevibacillus laterosporus GI-9]